MASIIHDGSYASNDGKGLIMINLKDVLDLYKINEVDDFLKKITGLTLNEKNLTYEQIKTNWRFLGDNPSNGSPIGILKRGEKGIIERITNGIDAVIEKQRTKYSMVSPQNSSQVIKKAFPKYYNNLQKIQDNQDKVRSQSFDIDNQVMLVINDGSKTNKPTFDIIDKGTGVEGKDFKDTLLSLNKGNKISSDKQYLIGAFGQGGSTSLPFTEATLIVSKINEKYYFTIIKAVDLKEFKNHAYVYLTINDEVIELDGNVDFQESYLDEFIQENSGTLIRMIETDISKEYRNNDISKPRMLVDYINTELFDVGVPIKLIENRGNFKDNKNIQNRNAYGTLNKLHTSRKYLKEQYSGTIDILHNNNPYKVDYYVILPDNEKDWGSDSKCRSVFEQFNVYGEPIIYTVNGQTITTERYTRIRNNGLTFLRYRLLIVINLDYLGNEKYKFFTSDRSQIKETDLTKGFLDLVIKRITSIDKLIEINDIIAEKSISSSVDEEMLTEITSEVQSLYNKFLKGGNSLPSRKSGSQRLTKSEEEFHDEIKELQITSKQREFYKDEIISFVLTTKAAKYINESALLYPYVNDKNFYNFSPNFMNGRIMYRFNEKSLKPGSYTLQFELFQNDNMGLKSEKISFEVLDERAPKEEPKEKTKTLDFKITVVDEAELICDIAKNKNDKSIEAIICLEGDELRREVYGFNSSNDEISAIKRTMIKPIVLFTLLLEDLYDNLENSEDKNKLIISHIKSLSGFL